MKIDITGAVPLGMPQRRHVHRVGQRLGAGQQPRHVGRATRAGRGPASARPPRRGAAAATPVGQRRDRSTIRGRRRAALPAAAVHQPQHGLAAAVGDPPRRRGGDRRRQAARSGSGRSIIRAEWVSRARCASTRHGRPSRTNRVSKTPSPRTAARSSANSSGVRGSCSSPSSVTTTAIGWLAARHGQEA